MEKNYGEERCCWSVRKESSEAFIKEKKDLHEMGDLASDRESAIKLILRDVPLLRAAQPDHPLVRYIGELRPEGFTLTDDPVLQREFYEIYLREQRTPVAVMLGRYYVDIHKALEEYK